MKKGFTLAEVLITLAIIGVVAALTIPTVISNYNKHQWYTRFMKAYNTLSTMVYLSDSDDIDFHQLSNLMGTSEEFECDMDPYIYYFRKYLKIAKMCDEFCHSECSRTKFVPDKTYERPLNIPDMLLRQSEVEPLGSALPPDLMFILEDNTFIRFAFVNFRGFYFIVDTNGFDKGPNMFGRDVFIFSLLKVKNRNTIAPYGLYTYYDGYWPMFYEPKLRTKDEVLNDPMTACDSSTDNSYNGIGCGVRLLLEGKMNY